MSMRKEDLVEMVESLDNEDRKAALTFIEFLKERAKNKTPEAWQKINELEKDYEPLSKEELCQYESEEGYISGEVAKDEYGLQVDLP